ncbi:MAG: MATE family efflux transporter [Clostridium sp.]
MFRKTERDKKFYRKVFIIALPIVIQNLITSSLNIVDTIMIGSLGEKEIAAVGIGNQYFFLLNIIIMGLFSGIGIFISQYYGKKDEENIRKLVGVGIISSFIVGGIFMVIALLFPTTIISFFNTDSSVIEIGASYLIIVCFSYIFTALSFNFAMASRCIEKAVIPMIASGIALIINTGLNYCLIFGELGFPRLGVEGAAIATLIARVIECIIIIGYIFLSKSILCGKIKEYFSFESDFIKRIVITVIPVLLNEACWGFGSVMYNVVYGRIGTSAIASVQIATTISNLFMVVIFGIASASLVIVGKEVGKGNEEVGVRYGNNSLKLGCIIGGIISVLIIVLAGNIVNLYNVSAEVKEWTRYILYVTSLVMIIRVYNIIAIVGVLRGGGDTKVSFYIEALTMWFIGVPVAFIGAFILEVPVYIVYALCAIEEIVKMIACLKRVRSKKWIKNLVLEENIQKEVINI